MIEYTSLLKNYNLYASEYEEAVLHILRSGWYILGPELDTFESSFAAYLGIKHCIGLNSGTDALILAVRALNIGCGDEVIVPAGTYIASILGITENGARPVYCDCTADTLLMDTSKLEALITDKTKAILPVHLYGQACDMTKIKEVAKKHNLHIIEDCAQCHGATWKGKFTGTEGTLSCFSFYPTKPLGALGDAGAICTNDDVLADKVRMLRNYGSRVKYYNESIGRNSRLDEIQAAVLQIGLKHLEEANNIRIRFAQKYFAGIKNPKVKLPYTDPNATHVYHLFPVVVDDQKSFQNFLRQKGIKTQVHYPIPPFIAECYQGTDAGYTREEGKRLYPNALYTAEHEVSLPIYSGMSELDIGEIIKAVNEY